MPFASLLYSTLAPLGLKGKHIISPSGCGKTAVYNLPVGNYLHNFFEMKHWAVQGRPRPWLDGSHSSSTVWDQVVAQNVLKNPYVLETTIVGMKACNHFQTDSTSINKCAYFDSTKPLCSKVPLYTDATCETASIVMGGCNKNQKSLDIHE